jgi:hypothetical protein
MVGAETLSIAAFSAFRMAARRSVLIRIDDCQLPAAGLLSPVASSMP